jgi:endonuclease/exonuclease/phosphatase family metal-dependent hydrolase
VGLFAKISNKVLFVINIIMVAVFLFACLNWYFNPQQLPLVSLLGLAFPFLLLLVLFFMVWWFFFKRKWALISAIAIILGGREIVHFFAFNVNSEFVETKNQKDIRIVTWNVARFIEQKKNNNPGSRARYKMLQQIKKTDADILCLQEFASSPNADWYNNIIAIGKGLNYPFYYFPHFRDGNPLNSGNVIFSRFPIIDSGTVRFPRPTLPEALVFVDIKRGGKMIRIYTTHLQSNQFKKEDISKIEDLKGGKSFWGNFPHIFSKLSFAIRQRSVQADMVNDIMKNSPYPVVFTGDLNDVPNSYTYHQVRGKLNDAFLKRGFGIGRTFSSISPTLRIDYFFYDNNFRLQQYKRVLSNYSDHFMLISDFDLIQEAK